MQHGPPSWRLAQDGTAAIHTRTVQAPQRQELFHLFGNGTAASHQTHGASHMTMHVSMVHTTYPGRRQVLMGGCSCRRFTKLRRAATGAAGGGASSRRGTGISTQSKGFSSGTKP